MTGFELFKKENPTSRATRWIGGAGSTGTVRRYKCYACGAMVDSESAKYRQTVHAAKAIEDHMATCPEILRYEQEATHAT